MADPIRSNPDRGVQLDTRVGNTLVPREGIAPAQPARKRWRDRIPSAAELAGLIVNGELRLPARYFRGFFLDLII
ncbi:hypothetical protein ACFSM5_06425 [Lacibacterium aquatile]|uniref:Uncharacterized protein n=1 Tax=Lacibacterium aquatile TaxID=1168082 RepID=A0ABW5DPN4_9PROT